MPFPTVPPYLYIFITQCLWPPSVLVQGQAMAAVLASLGIDAADFRSAQCISLREVPIVAAGPGPLGGVAAVCCLHDVSWHSCVFSARVMGHQLQQDGCLAVMLMPP